MYYLFVYILINSTVLSLYGELSNSQWYVYTADLLFYVCIFLISEHAERRTFVTSQTKRYLCSYSYSFSGVDKFILLNYSSVLSLGNGEDERWSEWDCIP